MLSYNLLALQVIIPLLAAPICFIIGNARLSWLFTALISVTTFIVSLLIFTRVLEFSFDTYAMGGWKAPVGIEYRIDLLNAFILMLVAGVAAITIFYAYKSVAFEVDKSRHSAFYALYLLCLAGLLGITITNDAFNIYVFLEISSLAMYGLIAMGKDRRAYLASFEYLVLGTIGATFILIAIGILYMMTGTLNLSDLASKLANVHSQTPIKAAFAFLVVGIILKAAMFPMHMWLANGYTNAPSFVSAFLAATGTKVSLYVLIRILFSLFGKEFSFTLLPMKEILLTLGVIGFTFGSIMAVMQHNVKRMLAYSSVAQVGYITFAIGLASTLGLAAAIVHIFNHAITKAALFMAVGCVAMRKNDGVRLAHFAGIAKQMPITFAAFIICGFSLVGFPLTAGFVSKFYMVKATLEQDYFIFAFLLLFSSFLALLYIWKVVEIAYFRAPEGEVKEAPFLMQLALLFMTGLTLFFGIYTDYTVDIAIRIGNILL